MSDDQGQEQQNSPDPFAEHNKGPLPPLGGTRDFDPYSGHNYLPPDTRETVQTPVVKPPKEYTPVVPMSHNAVEKGTDRPVAQKQNVPADAPGSNLPVGDPSKGLLQGYKK